MKRTVIAALVLLLLTGCGAKNRNIKGSTEPVTEERFVSVTENTTTAPRPIAERAAELQSADGTYIYDEQGVLTEEEQQQYNDYLGYLSRSRQVCAALVITDSLGGVSPEAFAQSYYAAVCGTEESGFLILVNNDTSEDYIYCTGACVQLLRKTDEVIAQATPALVERRYADALEILLRIGEQLSDRIFDRGNVLTADEMTTLDALAGSQEEGRCVLLLRGLPGTETELQPADTLEAPPMPTEAVEDPELPENPELPADPEDPDLPAPEDPENSQPDDNPEEETPAEETPAPARISEELKVYAAEFRTKCEARELLVIDAATGTVWLEGGDASQTEALQAAYDAQGAAGAVQSFYGGI